MLRFSVRRLLQLIPILFGLSILLFAVVAPPPGRAGYGPPGGARHTRADRRDQPRVRARPADLGSVLELPRRGSLRFDLGDSIQNGRPVTDVLRTQFPGTIELTIAALIFAVGVGIPLGYFAARRQGGPLDGLSVIGSLIGVTIPVFFLAFLLKYVFAVKLGWLPPSGRQDVRMNATHITNFFVLDGILTA